MKIFKHIIIISNTFPLLSFVSHEFICGFFSDNGDFMNISYFKLDKTRKEFIIE
jgi:hypothetical protein